MNEKNSTLIKISGKALEQITEEANKVGVSVGRVVNDAIGIYFALQKYKLEDGSIIIQEKRRFYRNRLMKIFFPRY